MSSTDDSNSETTDSSSSERDFSAKDYALIKKRHKDAQKRYNSKKIAAKKQKNNDFIQNQVENAISENPIRPIVTENERDYSSDGLESEEMYSNYINNANSTYTESSDFFESDSSDESDVSTHDLNENYSDFIYEGSTISLSEFPIKLELE
jgi:hypothetical protein